MTCSFLVPPGYDAVPLDAEANAVNGIVTGGTLNYSLVPSYTEPGFDGQAYMHEVWVPMDFQPNIPNHPTGGGWGGAINASDDNAPQKSSNKSCAGKAMGEFALHGGLDALGLIPGEGAAAAAFYGGKVAFQAVQFGAALVSTAASVDDSVGAGLGATGIGVSFVGRSTGLAKGVAEMVPLLAQGVAAAAVIWDAYNAYKDYKDCAKGGE